MKIEIKECFMGNMDESFLVTDSWSKVKSRFS